LAKILVSRALFSGLPKVPTVYLGSLIKASLVEAKTVNGLALFNVSIRPAAVATSINVV
jgi:hypothetical protein